MLKYPTVSEKSAKNPRELLLDSSDTGTDHLVYVDDFNDSDNAFRVTAFRRFPWYKITLRNEWSKNRSKLAFSSQAINLRLLAACQNAGFWR